MIEAWVKTYSGQVYRLQHIGTDTNSVEGTLRQWLPRIEELLTSGTGLLATAANLTDHFENFAVLSKDGRWRLVSALNEPWQGTIYRYALVEFAGGTRALGTVRLLGEPTSNTIHHVEFLELNGTQPQKLDPSHTRFALIMYALGWGDRHALTPSYGDLRHLFALPLIDPLGRQTLFYDQLVRQSDAAFAGRAVEFALVDYTSAPLSPELVHSALIRYGYESVSSAQAVRKPGHAFVADGVLTLRLHPAAYPVNTLVVSEDGRHVAFVSVGGFSGNVGANYWTFFRWVREQIRAHFGWESFAIFALDNGLDPTVQLFAPDGTRLEIPHAPQGRARVNAVLLATVTALLLAVALPLGPLATILWGMDMDLSQLISTTAPSAAPFLVATLDARAHEPPQPQEHSLNAQQMALAVLRDLAELLSVPVRCRSTSL
jgi:hypothetical protein